MNRWKLLAVVCGVLLAMAASPAMAEEHGESSSSGGPLDFKTDLAIWTAVVFLLLMGVLWRFAWGPIVEGLEKREQGIADNIAAAQRQHDEAKNLLAEYQAKLDESQSEVKAIVEEARRDAEHTQREILAKAKADAATERDRALKEIDTATQQALQELAQRSADLAVDLAGKIVQQKLTPQDHTNLIKQAVAKFAQFDPSQN